ncbi:hypothetical protein [Eubacterium xylanophilum]|uniref:hypothetical protein n=1 Tax=Eubacterium xylanophilum TaxID=39497 RepID=UPI0004B9F31E|nr:hypothetical protein [Eubacterium xylanophilum]
MKKTILFAVLAVILIIGAFIIFQKAHSPEQQEGKNSVNYIDENGENVGERTKSPQIETLSIEGEYTKECKDDVYVDKWEKNKEISVLKLNLKGEVGGYYDPSGDVCEFSSLLTGEEIVQANKDYYVGTMVLDNGDKGHLFFKDNNNYILEYGDKDILSGETFCRIYNMNARVDLENGQWVIFQMPVRMNFEVDIVKAYKKYKRDFYEDLYHFSFVDLVEFYKRIDKKYCSIDEENQVIRIAGRNLSTHKITKDYATIDYKNHRVITKESRGRKAYWESDKVYIK